MCLASGFVILSVVPALHFDQIGTAQAHTYIVRPNDTLSAIAARYHVSVRYLARVNGLADPDRLQAGASLTVPDGTGYGLADADSGYRDSRSFQAPAPATQMRAAGSSYVVVSGDTLSGLSSRFGVSLTTLAAANGIVRPDLLRVGQHLVIPASASAGWSGARADAEGIAPATSTPVTADPPSMSASSPDALPAAPIVPATSQAGVGSLLTSEAQAYGVDPALVKAVAWQESGWRMVTAVDGGIGVMQLMPATAAWVGPALLGRVIDPTNVTDNITAGVALLASYLRQYGDVRMALAAYNEGPQNLARGIGSTTAQYIANVLALRARFSQ
jgi:LysM repeat protein